MVRRETEWTGQRRRKLLRGVTRVHRLSMQGLVQLESMAQSEVSHSTIRDELEKRSHDNLGTAVVGTFLDR